MRYTASCLQMQDARIRGEKHSNHFARQYRGDLTEVLFPFLSLSGDNGLLLNGLRRYDLAARVMCRHQMQQQPPRIRLLQ